MDERDNEWLEKNNEEARGEGTSAQGAVSLSPGSSRSRAAKAKGKEPDVPAPIAMNEDEFELVMGIFEKATHEKTEFLHHVRVFLYYHFDAALIDLFRVSRQEWPFHRTLTIKTCLHPSSLLLYSLRFLFLRGSLLLLV
jgi:hypothetical protein